MLTLLHDFLLYDQIRHSVKMFVFGRVLSSIATITAMWYIDIFWAILQKALQTRDAASVAAAEALQEASAAESVLRSLR
jgi:hypothetical protein